MQGYTGGGRGTTTSAKVPLGSIAMPQGLLNRALSPTPSPKPAEPLPASVVVAPVAISTRRMRWLPVSCDASWEDTLRKSETEGLAAQCVVEIGAANTRCARRRCRLRDGAIQGYGPMQGYGATHADEREGAARVDRDADCWRPELGASAGAVEEASRAAAGDSRAVAGEGGGRPGGDIDTANAAIVSVLQGSWEDTLRKRAKPKVWPHSGCVPSAGWRDAGVYGRGARHQDEREGAARVDRDASRLTELGAAAGAVAEAPGAAAGERGGDPGGDNDMADTVVGKFLRCIMERHAERGASQRKGRGVAGASRYAATPGGCRPGTHHNEREGAGRVDRDAPGVVELGARAGAVEEAPRAAAGERGGHPAERGLVRGRRTGPWTPARVIASGGEGRGARPRATNRQLVDIGQRVCTLPNRKEGIRWELRCEPGSWRRRATAVARGVQGRA
eukprot:scaffold92250_cov61-Phaeocystis_antarctica.AAC.4